MCTWLFICFFVLWMTAWLEYCCQFIVMVSAASYYFDSDASKEGSATVGLGFKFAHRYHAGSLAVGSFVIALIRFIKILFLYAAKQAEKASGDNRIVKCIAAYGTCVLNCIEKICDYINESAYSYMAVSGKSFFPSAWDAFLLQIKHLAKFAFANLLAKVFIFLGKVAITVGNVFSLYFIMKNITMDTEEVSSLAGPFLVVAVFSYLTASVFLGLFDTAVLSLMTSLAIDMDLHDGNPAFGPPTFHESVQKIEKSKVDQETGNTMS